MLERSSFIYKYTCCCAQTYIGETGQRLSDRIKQHIPDKLYQQPPNLRSATSDSAITKHMQSQTACIPRQRNERFTVVASARNAHHRAALEALYIRSMKPPLCAQKKFVKALRLFR